MSAAVQSRCFANKPTVFGGPSGFHLFQQPSPCESADTVLQFIQCWSFDFPFEHFRRGCEILKNILERILPAMWLSSEVISNAVVDLFSPLRFSIPSDSLKECYEHQQSCH